MGLKTAARSAVFGGVLLAMIEGMGIMLNKHLSPPAAGGGPNFMAEMQAQGMGPGGAPLAVSDVPDESVLDKMKDWLGFGGSEGGSGDSSSSGPKPIKDLSNDKFAQPDMPTFK